MTNPLVSPVIVHCHPASCRCWSDKRMVSARAEGVLRCAEVCTTHDDAP